MSHNGNNYKRNQATYGFQSYSTQQPQQSMYMNQPQYYGQMYQMQQPVIGYYNTTPMVQPQMYTQPMVMCPNYSQMYATVQPNFIPPPIMMQNPTMQYTYPVPYNTNFNAVNNNKNQSYQNKKNYKQQTYKNNQQSGVITSWSATTGQTERKIGILQNNTNVTSNDNQQKKNQVEESNNANKTGDEDKKDENITKEIKLYNLKDIDEKDIPKYAKLERNPHCKQYSMIYGKHLNALSLEMLFRKINNKCLRKQYERRKGQPKTTLFWALRGAFLHDLETLLEISSEISYEIEDINNKNDMNSTLDENIIGTVKEPKINNDNNNFRQFNEPLVTFKMVPVIVIYLGSNPPLYINHMRSLLPLVTWHIYTDKDNTLRKSRDERIIIHNEGFTNEIAAYLNKKFDLDKPVFLRDDKRKVIFISEFSATKKSVIYTNDEADEIMKYEMDSQRLWVELMRPDVAVTKFKLPWKCEDYIYLDGEVIFPIFGHHTATDSRIISYKSWSNEKYETKINDNQKLELETKNKIKDNDGDLIDLDNDIFEDDNEKEYYEYAYDFNEEFIENVKLVEEIDKIKETNDDKVNEDNETDRNSITFSATDDNDDDSNEIDSIFALNEFSDNSDQNKTEAENITSQQLNDLKKSNEQIIQKVDIWKIAKKHRKLITSDVVEKYKYLNKENKENKPLRNDSIESKTFNIKEYITKMHGITKLSDSYFPKTTYNCRKFEEIMFMFNTETRVSCYDHLIDLSNEKYSKIHDGLDYCYDCSAEVKLWRNSIASSQEIHDFAKKIFIDTMRAKQLKATSASAEYIKSLLNGTLNNEEKLINGNENKTKEQKNDEKEKEKEREKEMVEMAEDENVLICTLQHWLSTCLGKKTLSNINQNVNKKQKRLPIYK